MYLRWYNIANPETDRNKKSHNKLTARIEICKSECDPFVEQYGSITICVALQLFLIDRTGQYQSPRDIDNYLLYYKEINR